MMLSTRRESVPPREGKFASRCAFRVLALLEADVSSRLMDGARHRAGDALAAA